MLSLIITINIIIIIIIIIIYSSSYYYVLYFFAEKRGYWRTEESKASVRLGPEELAKANGGNIFFFQSRFRVLGVLFFVVFFFFFGGGGVGGFKHLGSLGCRVSDLGFRVTS